MVTPRKAERQQNRRRYIPVKDLPIDWKDTEQDSGAEQDWKFQAHMQSLGFVPHTSTEACTSAPKSANNVFYGSAPSQSSADW